MRFTPLNLNEEESISDMLMHIDNIIQYGEDGDTKTKDFEQPDPDENDGEIDYSNYWVRSGGKVKLKRYSTKKKKIGVSECLFQS